MASVVFVACIVLGIWLGCRSAAAKTPERPGYLERLPNASQLHKPATFRDARRVYRAYRHFHRR